MSVPALGFSTFPVTSILFIGLLLESFAVTPFKFSPLLNLSTSLALISIGSIPCITGATSLGFTTTSLLYTVPK